MNNAKIRPASRFGSFAYASRVSALGAYIVVRADQVRQTVVVFAEFPIQVLRLFKWQFRLKRDSITSCDASQNAELMIAILETLGRLDTASYLEIRILDGSTIHRIPARRKIGVDPKPLFKLGTCDDCTIHIETSESFFASYRGEKFDLIFLNGTRKYEQFLEDLASATRVLRSCGVIVIDGVWPRDQHAANRNRWRCFLGRALDRGSWRNMRFDWCADVFRMLPLLHAIMSDYRTVERNGHAQLVMRLSDPTKARDQIEKFRSDLEVQRGTSPFSIDRSILNVTDVGELISWLEPKTHKRGKDVNSISNKLAEY